MPTFDEILKQGSLFKDRNVLSPHFVPEKILHRDAEIEKIMRIVAPAVQGKRINNLFIYGKTGTGKTSSVRKIMEEFARHAKDCSMVYANCRVYNSKYKAFHKALKDIVPELDKLGFGLSFLYERLIEQLKSGKSFVFVMDEIDMVKDLDDLIYTVTRANDESQKGFVSIIGISNRLSFKEKLDPRSRSSLCEVELVFHSYNPVQLHDILNDRVKNGFEEGVIEESAINLAAAITGSESGDARYALTLLLRAGELAEQKSLKRVTDSEVEEARRFVDDDVIAEVVKSLPENQRLVLLAVAQLSTEGTKQVRLGDSDNSQLLSGEVYERYGRLCKTYGKKLRSARWYREYINELEMLGLIIVNETGKGMRGRSRFIRAGYLPERIKELVEKGL